MKKHVKIYLDYFGYCTDDVILCEVCGKRGCDIHHLDNRKIGGSKTKDYIENLQCLCRECHVSMGDKKQYKEYLQNIHNEKIERYRKR